MGRRPCNNDCQQLFLENLNPNNLSYLSEDLGVTQAQKIEHRGLVRLLLEVLIALLGGDERPELVEVDNGLPEVVLLLVEVTHTNLTEVTVTIC